MIVCQYKWSWWTIFIAFWLQSFMCPFFPKPNLILGFFLHLLLTKTNGTVWTILYCIVLTCLYNIKTEYYISFVLPFDSVLFAFWLVVFFNILNLWRVKSWPFEWQDLVCPHSFAVPLVLGLSYCSMFIRSCNAFLTACQIYCICQFQF